jgi:hypothetical protein
MNNILEIIKEHCTYCPEDLNAVISALLSVEESLDYEMKYQLEYLLKQYVIARAKMEPDGLKSILDAFPLNKEDSSNVEESLVSSAEALQIKTNEINNDYLKSSMEKLVRTAHDMKDGSKHEEDKDEKDSKKKKLKDKEHMKESLAPNLELLDMSELEELRLDSKVTSQSSSDGSSWRVRLIQQGHTLSGRYFPNDVLRESVPLFEGTRSYMNHPPENYQGGDRPLQTLIGWYDNVTLKEGDGLYADWHILANSGVPWLREQMIELSKNGKLDLIGLSLLGLGKNSFKRVDGKVVKYSESIQMVRSVDLVDVPGAGGKVESIIESKNDKTRSEIMELERLTLEELKQANPGLVQEILKESKVTPPLEPEPEPDPDENTSKLTREAMDILNKMRLQERNSALANRLRESNIPQPMKDAVKKQFSGKIFEDSDLEEQITIYKESAAAIAPYTSESKFHVPSQAYMITEEERMQAAMDRLFGLPVSEEFSNTPRLSGIREAYLMMTGDYSFTWGAIPLDERMREALPTAASVVGGGTITFSNVLGTSMNRRLLRQYKQQVMWWEPFMSITELTNLKQQDRNRLESLGSLSERTTGGAEYVELDWDEAVHNYTPTEYGNIVPIAQRAIVNDDLNGLVRVSTELGRSAAITLNEYVSNLFTQNSGDGPTFVDVGQDGVDDAGGTKVFQGTATTEHNNRITGPLNRANYKDADQRIRTMVDKSGKRIGLFPEFLLIPHEIRESAIQLQQSERVPDSANNARNIYQNDFVVIEVPQFTDANNWYLLTGSGQIDLIEMGFLNGRREPELWIQSDPTAGMNFTHDVLAYKLRHRYGGGWLDYRGAVASIV